MVLSFMYGFRSNWSMEKDAYTIEIRFNPVFFPISFLLGMSVVVYSYPLYVWGWYPSAIYLGTLIFHGLLNLLYWTALSYLFSLFLINLLKRDLKRGENK